MIRIDIKNSTSCVCLDSFSNVFNQLLCLSNHEGATLKLCSPGGCSYYKGFYKNGDDWYVKLDPKVEKVLAWTKAGTLCCPCTETMAFPTYKRMKFSPCPKPGKPPVKCESLCVAFCIVKDH